MEFDHDFVNPEGLDKKEEGEGEHQPHSGENLNKCNQGDYAECIL